MNALCVLHMRLSQLPVEKCDDKPALVISEDGCGAKGGTSAFTALQVTGRGVTACSEQQNRANSSGHVRVWKNLPANKSYPPLSRSFEAQENGLIPTV